MSGNVTIELLLKARLQQLAQDQRVRHQMPNELRREVFLTLDLIDTFGEITRLFTSLLGETTATFIDLLKSP